MLIINIKNNYYQRIGLYRFLWTQLLLVMSNVLVGQVGSYSFVQTSTTYKQAGNGASLTLASTTYDDNSFTAVTLPFTFTYHGVAFTSVGISANGFVQLGAAATSSYSAITAYSNILSPLNTDLYGLSSTVGHNISYATTSGATGRIFTVQWTNWGFFSSGANEFSFQLKLYEGTNQVQFVYQNGTATGAGTAYVGMTGATTSDFRGRTTTTNWAATTAAASTAASTCTISSTIRPTNGLTFTWASAATVAAMVFTQSTTTYVPIEAGAGTVLTNSTSVYDDTNLGSQTIPFTFTYHGSSYTSAGIVSPNGFIQLGSSATASGYSAICSYADILSPLNSDLYSAAATVGREVSVVTIGTTPNRIWVVQWSNWGIFSTGLNEFSFQLRLTETTNTIQYVYGPSPGTNAATAYVGLTGASNSDFQTRTTTTSWSATTSAGAVCTSSTISSTVRPVNGLTFTFTPPTTPPCVASPTSPTNAATNVSATGTSLSWSAASGATGYDVYFGTTNPAPTLVSSNQAGTSYSPGTLLDGTTYYWRIVPRNGAGPATGCTNWSFTTALPGESCSNPQNLATLTSPYSSTTVGYATNNLNPCHNASSPDRVFYLSVPNGYTVDIYQSTNGYDSYHYMGYGATCASTTQIYCIDDVDTQNNPWTNNTGLTQTVWFVLEGYSGQSGIFTLNWTLTPPASPPTITSFTPSPACSGATVTINGTNLTGASAVSFGGTAATSYTVVSATQITAVVGAGAAGSVSVTTGGGTATLAGFTMNTSSTAPSSISGTSTICVGASTTLTQVGGSLGTAATYSWFLGSCGGTFVGTGTSVTVSPSTTTTYYVRAQGTCNTTTCASVTVTVNPLPTAAISPSSTTICVNTSTTLTASGANELANVLNAINVNTSTLVNSIPTPSGFTMDLGVNATNISDGCGDMFDGGNFINTNLAATIAYSDNAITANATALGTGGQYFTRYITSGTPGCQAGPAAIFYWAADINGLSTISITGNNGADGGGTQDVTTFTVTANGITYNCFLKRVYGATDPSINQLFLIPQPNSASQAIGTTTDDALQTISGLTGVTRIYYMLYAGANGALISNAQATTIAQTFANIIPVSYTWNTGATTRAITVSPSTTTTYTVTVNNLGCTATANSTVNVTPIPGNPATFGTSAWNIYGYDGNDINLGGAITYKGFYTETALSYNTINRWGSTLSPSSANATGGTAWSGCAIPADNHTVVAKRTNFTTGIYQIDIPSHDDGVQVWVNGTKVFENLGCCVQHTAVWTGTLTSTSTVEIRQAEGAGGSGHAVTVTQLTLAATPSRVNPTPYTCATNGSITISSPSGAVGCTIANSDFTTAPGSVAVSGTATVTSGYLQLTTTVNGQQGNAIISMPSTNYNVTDFVAEFDIFATAAGGADGMSFSYGGDIPTNAGSETGVSNTGLQIGFMEYTGAGGPKIEIRYNSALLQSTAFANLANSTWRQCVVRVNASGQLTLTLGGTAVATALSLPGYAAASKLGWKMAFSGRTGGLNNAHLVDNLNIVAYSQYEYSIDNITWYSTNAFANLGIGTYIPYIRNICQSASPLTLTTQTLSATATPGTPATYGTNQWNVYAYNGYNLNTYFGFYTTTRTAEFNIGSDGMGATSNPSAITGGTINGATVSAYTGCSLGNDSWSISAKRQGFPCGVYNLNLAGYDDEYILNIDYDGNGTVDNTYTGTCCNLGTGVKWTGVLNSSSKVEIILKEGGGDAYIDIDFNLITPAIAGGTIAGITDGVTICNATDPGSFATSGAASGGIVGYTNGGAYSYQWESSITSNSSNFTNISGATAQTYDPGTLTATTWFRRKVTDACGNTIYSNVIQVIVIPYATGGTIATVTTCAGTNVTVNITGASNATQYSWVLPAGFTGSSTSSSITVTAASPTSQTNYTITAYPQNVSGGTTCTGTAVNGTITVRPLPQVSNFASASGGTSICNGDIGQLIVTTSNGTGPFTVVYNNGTSNQTATGVVSGTAFNASPNPTSGTTTYTLVSVTDANGCVRTTAFTDGTAQISVRQLPTATISGTTAVCQGGASPNITFTGSNTGGTAPPYTFSYNINGGATQTITTTSGSSVTIAASTASLGVTTYNLLGISYASNPACSNTATGSATVTVNPNHTLALTSAGATTTQTVCNGVAITNITYSVGGGATGAGVTGLPSGVTGNFSGGVFTISGTPTADGTYNYTVTTTGNACSPQSLIGTITVNSLIDWANLQFPTTGTICPSGSVNIYGRFYEGGVTTPAGAPSNVVVELGYSISNTNPNTWTNWTAATFNAQYGNDDEFIGTLSGLSTGTYYYAFRYSLNGCAYQYGGTNGFWNGTTNISGVLTVEPNHTITLSSAAPTTSQTLCQNVAITDITYTLGGGATGANVTGLPTGVSASVTGTTLTISGTPSVDGTFNYAITTTGNTCTVATANGTITVKSLLDYVNLQFPSSGAICENGSFTAYGRVYEPGLTPAAGAGAGIVAEIGYSTTNSNPATWTNWSAASFNTQQGNNDEFIATFGSLLAAGTYYYTFRYSLDGCQWQYGGYSAGGGGFWNGSTFTSGVLTINASPTITLGAVTAFCQGPTSFNLPYSATTLSPDQYSVSTGTPAVSGFSAITNASLVASPLNIPIPNATVAGAYQFYISVRNSTTTCSSANQAFTVTINPRPSALTCKVDDSCQKSLGQITLTVTGGTSPYTIAYSPSGTPTSPITTSAASTVITGLTGGQTYNFTVSDVNGCVAP